jgi:hypothetical protein
VQGTRLVCSSAQFAQLHGKGWSELKKKELGLPVYFIRMVLL